MRRSVLLVLLFSSPVTSATAQSLGVFRWQTLPVCNVITVAVTTADAAYRLEGTDDQCGGTPAWVIGMTYPSGAGSIGAGLTIVAPGAVALHLDATILPASGYSGTWGDSAGQSGRFVFNPGPSPGGPARPVVGNLRFGVSMAQPPGGSDRGLSVAVSADGGAAGDAAAVFGVDNGAIRVTGGVRAAFRVTIPGTHGIPNSVACTPVYHPLLDGDPNALVLVTPHLRGDAWAEYHDPAWYFYTTGSGGPASVLGDQAIA